MFARRPTPKQEDQSKDGEGASLFDLLKDFGNYLAVRTELVGLEAKEATDHLLRQAILGTILAITAVGGYAMLLAAATSFLSHLYGTLLSDKFSPYSTALAALSLALPHFLGAFVLLRKLKNPPRTPLFAASRYEFQKDRLWIHDRNRSNEKKS